MKENVLREMGVAAAVVSNLPERPGYNGCILLIDDIEAENIAKALNHGQQEIERLYFLLKEIHTAFEAKTAPEQWLMDKAKEAQGTNHEQA